MGVLCPPRIGWAGTSTISHQKVTSTHTLVTYDWEICWCKFFLVLRLTEKRCISMECHEMIVVVCARVLVRFAFCRLWPSDINSGGYHHLHKVFLFIIPDLLYFR